MDLFLISFICTVIQIPALLLRLVPFKNNISKKQKYILATIYSVFFVLNNTFWILLFNFGNVNLVFYKYSLTIFSLLMTMVNIVVIKGRIKEHIFVSGTEFLIGRVLVISIDFFLQFFNIGDISRYIQIHAIIVTIAYLICYPYIEKLLTRTVTPFLEMETKDYWKRIWLIPFTIYFATIVAYPPDAIRTTLFQLLSQYLIAIATVLICYSVMADSLRIREKIEFSEQLGQQKAHYSALSERVMEMRRIKHDAKHHNDSISYYIDKNDKDGLYNYCKEMVKPLKNNIDIPYSGNNAVDGLIYRYMELAQKEDVKFTISGDFNDIGISDVDICVLLGNALDNAFTACLNLESNRYVMLSVRKDRGALTIMLQNSFDGIVEEKEHKIFSRKRNNELGIGLYSMQSICEKYGGNMEIRHEDNTFSIMFYNL